MYDGATVYYANTAVKDDSERSALLQLFLKKDSFDSKEFPNLSEAVKYFKETEKGREEMCAVVEDYAEKYAETQKQKQDRQTKIKIAKKLIKLNLSDKDISEATELYVEEVSNLREAE